MTSTRSSKEEVKYVHQLPYSTIQVLSSILDIGTVWAELGGKYLNLNFSKVNELKYRYRISGESPTEEVLKQLGTKNLTVNDLYFILLNLKHHQAMSILKPYVDRKYHSLVNEGDKVPKDIFPSVPNDNFYNIREIPHSTHGQPMPSGSVERAPGIRLDEPSGANGPDPNRVGPVEDYVFRFPFEEIQAACDNFNKDNELGRGAFGTVFKGTLRQNTVAIKMIKKTINPGRTKIEEIKIPVSFQELKALNRFRHENIIVLHGYSQHDDCLCLIYEYMINGSLEDRLQCKNGTDPLTWWHRANIARGTAHGLQFLHTFGPMIHGDIKSANILLDKKLEPKIGDFGLAREGPHSDRSYTMVSDLRGTEPYLPPEYMRSYQLSTKLDTYSFGVVLFEIGTGHRAFLKDGQGKRKLLVEIVKECQEMEVLRDLKAGPDFLNVFGVLMEKGVTCTHRTKKERPDMQTIHNDLDQLMEKMKERRPSGALSTAMPVASTSTPVDRSTPQELRSEVSKTDETRFDSPPPSYQQFVDDDWPQSPPWPPATLAAVQNEQPEQQVQEERRPSQEAPPSNIPILSMLCKTID